MIDCKAIATERKKYLKEYIEQNNKDLCLMVIQVGDNPAWKSVFDSYISVLMFL